MVEVLVGVVVGYILAMLPRAVSFFDSGEKAVGKKAREPTEEEKRQVQRQLREYNNFLVYDGTEQEEIIV